MEFIASILREFDALKLYSEKERIAVIQNGLRDDLRQIARGQAWNTVLEMELHLRTVEVAEELHRDSAPRKYTRPFIPNAQYRKTINAVAEDEHSEYEPSEGTAQSEADEENGQIEMSKCNAMKQSRFAKRTVTDTKGQAPLEKWNRLRSQMINR